MKNVILIIYVLTLSFASYAIPFGPRVDNHISGLPGAGVQNWGLSTSSISGIEELYVGNSKGMLTFNGSDWAMFLPGKSAVVRDVKIVGDKVFAAGNNNIGYFTYSDDGQLAYTSLLPNLNQLGINWDEFWHIAAQGSLVYFHSFSNILCWDGDSLSTLVYHQHFRAMCQAGKEIILQGTNGKLSRIENGRIKTYDLPIDFESKTLRFACQQPEGPILIGMEDGSLYSLTDTDCQLITVLESSAHYPLRVECGALHNSLLAVGTIGNGLRLYDISKQQPLHFDNFLLADRNVHALCFDNQGVIWTSLDYGVASVNLNPTTDLWTHTSEIGIFFDAVDYNGKSWIATNRGLYCDDGVLTSQYHVDWKPLKFSCTKDELLCGTTGSLYRLNPNNNQFELVNNVNGVEQMEYIADQGKEYLVLRGYSGLSYMIYEDGHWRFMRPVFNAPYVKSILPESAHLIWGIDPDSGIKRMRISDDFSNIVSIEEFSEIDGLKDFSSVNLLKIDNKVYFFTPNGLYEYDPDHKTFVQKENLTNNIPYFSDLIHLFHTRPNRVLGLNEYQLFFYSIKGDSVRLDSKCAFLHSPLMEYDGHYNFRGESDSLFMVATNEGIALINPKRQPIEPDGSMKLLKSFYTKDNATIFLNRNSNTLKIPYSAQDFSMVFASGLSYPNTYYSYRMVNRDDEWSKWQASGVISFPLLPSGTHQIEVRDSNDNIQQIKIVVTPPFFKSGWAYFLYFLIVVVGIAAVAVAWQRRTKQRLQAQLEEEERQHKEEMQQKSVELLTAKVHEQETELKNNLRFLTQKQELLDEISSEIDSQKKELGDRWPNKLYYRLVKVLQSGATETDKLLSFENYFVEIQRDFMTKLSQAHPDLTQSELRLCCLIRSNLSTKEIAAVMGIGTRSVELKRYRLKKKLNLSQDSSLTTYIFSI